MVPWEGEATTHISALEERVVRGVTAQGGGRHRGV